MLAQQDTVATGLRDSVGSASKSSLEAQNGSEVERPTEVPSAQGEVSNESRSRSQSRSQGGIRSRGPSDVAPAGTINEEPQELGIGELRSVFAGEREEESKESESPESAVLWADVLAPSRQGPGA